MRVLYLCSTTAPYDGWGRISAEFIGAARETGILPTVFSHSSPSRGQDFFAAFRLRKTAYETDLIHCLTEPTFAVGRILARRFEKPLILSVHGTYATRVAAHTAGREAYEIAARVTSPSNYTRRELLAALPNVTDKIQIVPWAVPSIFQDVEYCGWEQREPIVITVGEVKPRKGTMEVVEAFAIAKRRVGDAKLIVVGAVPNSEYVRAVRQRIAQLGLEHSVIWTGRVNPNELIDWYRRARVLAMPSVRDGDSFEGFGLVHLEAHACGLPSIGTARSAHEEVIENNRSGFLLDPFDCDRFAEALMLLLQDQATWSQLSQNAREMSLERTWPDIVRDCYHGIQSQSLEGNASSLLASAASKSAVAQSNDEALPSGREIG